MDVDAGILDADVTITDAAVAAVPTVAAAPTVAAVPTMAVAATELTEQDLTMVTLSATETDLMQLPTTAVAATADAAAPVDAAAQCRLMMEAAAAITN